MRELNSYEIDQVSGAWVGVVVTVVLAVAAAGYQMGKDAAERDNRGDD